MMTTLEPMRPNKEANSVPTTPPPITAMLSGGFIQQNTHGYNEGAYKGLGLNTQGGDNHEANYYGSAEDFEAITLYISDENPYEFTNTINWTKEPFEIKD